MTLARLRHRRTSTRGRPHEAAPNTLLGSGARSFFQDQARRSRNASAPQKLIRAATPASQSDGLTSKEGPSSVAARRAGSLAAIAQQVASIMSAGPGRGPIKATRSGWATWRTETDGVSALRDRLFPSPSSRSSVDASVRRRVPRTGPAWFNVKASLNSLVPGLLPLPFRGKWRRYAWTRRVSFQKRCSSKATFFVST